MTNTGQQEVNQTLKKGKTGNKIDFGIINYDSRRIKNSARKQWVSIQTKVKQSNKIIL
jgi:hypothetical protein